MYCFYLITDLRKTLHFYYDPLAHTNWGLNFRVRRNYKISEGASPFIRVRLCA